MNNRFRINALATLVIGAGVAALSGAQPASASSFASCEAYEAARAEHIQTCMNMGGSSISITGWCTDNGFYIDSTCHFGGKGGFGIE
jgi:hypothetical protein